MEGYDIFIIAGDLPPIDSSKKNIDCKGTWWDIDSIGTGLKKSKTVQM
jgi:hypothetical protein